MKKNKIIKYKIMDGYRRRHDCFPDDNDDFGIRCIRSIFDDDFDKGWIRRPRPPKGSILYIP